MAYNLGTTRTRIQQKLDNTNFDTAKLNQFINDGQRDILNARRFTFMERETTATTTDDSDQLTISATDIQIPLSLRLYSPVNNSSMLTYIQYEDFDVVMPNPNLVSKTIPFAWYIFNGIPAIYPKADATYTIAIRYIKSPTELTSDSDVPEIPEAFSELLVLAGYKRALEHDDDYDQAQIIQQQIDEKIVQMDERYSRQKGLPHIMRSPWRTRRSPGGF